jgi:hypothetical protein
MARPPCGFTGSRDSIKRVPMPERDRELTDERQAPSVIVNFARRAME